MMSFCFPGVMVTLPLACGRHAAMFGEGTSPNEKDESWPPPPAGAADALEAAVSPSAKAMPPAAETAATRRERRPDSWFRVMRFLPRGDAVNARPMLSGARSVWTAAPGGT